jgi:hypothetical protein
VVGVVGAAAIGVIGMITVDPALGAFIAVGVFLVLAYNLELAAGRFHSNTWFALAWGGFPVVTAYFAQTGTIAVVTVFGAAFATAMSAAQRHLSTQVRQARRHVARIEGRVDRSDGTAVPVTRETLIGPAEHALRAMALACGTLAAAMLIMRVA